MKLKQLLYGAATFLPGISKLRATGTGGTDSARYCYTVWLRHLVLAHENGLSANPRIVAELGPGDSLGISLAALFSGCETCYAFDVVEHANVDDNLAIFDELVALFNAKTPIPADDEWPGINPRLENYEFPSAILSDERLRNSLDGSRLDRIRKSLENPRGKDSMIQYKVPWFDAGVLQKHSVDMIFSQAVLEHVDELRNTYRAMRSWLKPSGYMSHSIDFGCHGTAEEWNGHWAHSDTVWKLIRGRRAYLLNREPYATHLSMLEQERFTVVSEKKMTVQSSLTQADLAPRFRSVSDSDLVTRGAFFQAVKTPDRNS